jgi:hypothetical protein
MISTTRVIKLQMSLGPCLLTPTQNACRTNQYRWLLLIDDVTSHVGHSHKKRLFVLRYTPP